MKIYEIEAGDKIDIADKDSQDQLQDFVTVVRAQCGEALNAMKSAGRFLYRGLFNSAPEMFHGRPRENRQPLNKHRLQSQLMFDAALSKQGIKANRSNSIFCSGDLSQAYVYADNDKDVYLIFPINGFDFSWSPHVRDLVSEPNYRWNQQTEQEFYDKYIISQEYTNTNFDKALISGYEIMIHGEYYAIRSPYQNRIAGGLFK